MMKNRINLLRITGVILSIGALYFVLINWGISLGLIICAIVLLTANRLLRKSSNRKKNIIAISIWSFTLIVTYHYSKRVVIHVEGKPEIIYIITGEADKKAIHSSWKWTNDIYIDTSNVIYTSSSLSQLNNLIIVDEHGKKIRDGGHGSSTQECLPNSSLIRLQTEYYKSNDSFNENDKGFALSSYQMSKCK